MPLKGGMLDFLQDNVKERLNDIQFAATSQPSGLTIVPLRGYYEVVGGTYNIYAGAVMISGEIYTWNNIAITPALGQVVVGTITEVSATGTGLDPVQFSNASNYNVNMNRVIVWSAAPSGTGTFNLSIINQYFAGFQPVTYAAGKLFASSGTWTIPAGAADWYVAISWYGCLAHVKFAIRDSTLSNNTSSIRFVPDYLSGATGGMKAIRSATGMCFYQNANDAPTSQIARVDVIAGDASIYITKWPGSNMPATTGSLTIEGEIIYECERGFNV